MKRTVVLLALAASSRGALAHDAHHGSTQPNQEPLPAPAETQHGHLEGEVLAIDDLIPYGRIHLLETRLNLVNQTRLQAFHVDGIVVEVGGGFSVSSLGLFRRRNDFVGATATAVNVVGGRFQRRADLGRTSWLLEAGAALSLFQSTVGDVPLRYDASGHLVLCGSQSQASLAAAFSFDHWLTARLDTTLQGDPFHFSTGQDCLGDPVMWLEGRRVAGEINLRLRPGLYLVGRLEHQGSRVAHDLEDERGRTIDYGVVHASDVSGSLALTIRH